MTEEIIKSFEQITNSISQVNFKPLAKAIAEAVGAFEKLTPPKANLSYGTWIVDYVTAKTPEEQYAAFCRGYRLQKEVIAMDKLTNLQLKIAYTLWQRPRWLKHLSQDTQSCTSFRYCSQKT